MAYKIYDAFRTFRLCTIQYEKNNTETDLVKFYKDNISGPFAPACVIPDTPTQHVFLHVILFEWQTNDIENNHTYINFLFPLPKIDNTESIFFDTKSISIFKTNPTLQRTFIIVFEYIMNKLYFCQIKIKKDNVIIIEQSMKWRGSVLFSKKEEKRKLYFVYLTRIMKCLTLVGLKPLAMALQLFLKTNYIMGRRYSFKVPENIISDWENATGEHMIHSINSPPYSFEHIQNEDLQQKIKFENYVKKNQTSNEIVSFML
jgi:hypothetical protein